MENVKTDEERWSVDACLTVIGGMADILDGTDDVKDAVMMDDVSEVT